MKRRLSLLILFLVLSLGGLGSYLYMTGRLEELKLPNFAGAPAGAPEEKGRAEAITPPSFDVVRVEPDGDTVMAGLAPPGWTVRIESQAGLVGEVKAESDGAWVLIPKKPLSRGEHSLTLSARAPDGSKRVYAPERVAISVAGNAEPLVALSEEGKPTRLLQRGGGATKAEGAAAQMARQGAQNAMRAAMQPPASQAGSGVPEKSLEAEVTIASVDLEQSSEESRLFISGQAASGSRVALYADNRFLGMAIADRAGVWSFDTDVILGAGTHKIRADQVDSASGHVTARAEVSYEQPPASASDTAEAAMSGQPQRQAGQQPSPAGASQTQAGARRVAPTPPASPAEQKARERPRVVIVRRGDSLWQIARKFYGNGRRYTRIFRDNRRQIRNPDLIYPDQRIKLPD